MYVAIAVLSVPEANREEYEKSASFMADWSMSHGALEVMELWESNVPDGKTTDLRKAVAAPDGEKIVAGWIVWPDKETLQKAQQAMGEGEGFEGYPEGDPPFDGSRLIWGEFTPVLTRGRD
ncbi:DUF1428 domain-containing protein [Erythrobacter sp. YT30]|uniref:DUF1428 domain-containing protein n=1 Tax=Erythrobacter sp. YT30 TaxID=1735012 RepID=UPI00076DE835|nr:DUF1428 domain-containing protein [Erythrobacter sp. YT30]KWV90553.1 hypothetical protein AUC45_15090 [Erythrobacter sp. YT30]